MFNFLSARDLSKDDIWDIINNVQLPHMAHLFWATVPKATLLFAEPSTRTAGSFDEAARKIGWDRFVVLGGGGTSLAKNESIADTVSTFGGKNQGADALIMRTGIEGSQRFAAEIIRSIDSKTAIINAGDGRNQHPTQGLLDFFTINHFKKDIPFEELTIGFVGDFEKSRVVHSDLDFAKILGVKRIRLVSVPEVAVGGKYKRGFEDVIEGDDINILNDCDVVIVLRVQQERYKDDPMKLAQVLGKFKITEDVLNNFKKDAIVMHPQPCIDEIDPRIKRTHPKIKMYEQSCFGVPVREIVLMKALEDNSNCVCNTTEKVELKKMDEYPIGEKIKNQKQFFKPITNGTIIDHIPCDQGDIVKIFLKSLMPERRTPAFLGDKNNSKNLDQKDVLFLRDGFIEDNTKFLEILGFLYPDITINVLRDGMHRKFKIKTPEVIKGALSCLNDKCISNIDPECETKFINVMKERVDCAYCEKEFSLSDFTERIKPTIGMKI